MFADRTRKARASWLSRLPCRFLLHGWWHILFGWACFDINRNIIHLLLFGEGVFALGDLRERFILLEFLARLHLLPSDHLPVIELILHVRRLRREGSHLADTALLGWRRVKISKAGLHPTIRITEVLLDVDALHHVPVRRVVVRLVAHILGRLEGNVVPRLNVALRVS